MPLENGTLSQGTNRLGEKLETSSSGIFPRHIQGEVLEPIPESGVASDFDDNAAPPSFAQSEFQTIIRRQRHGNDPDGLKIRHHPSRSPHLKNDWEFAGWGSMSYLDVSLPSAETLRRPHKFFGQLKATSVAGNGLAGGVFYTFPAVIAVAGTYAPICLVFAASLLLFLRPLLLELASAVRLNGANYIYLLQFSGKTFSILGATATLLDAIATATVSSATASTYLYDEFTSFPLSTGVLTIIFLVVIGVVVGVGGKESAVVSASVFVFHLATMAALILASIVHWARMDPNSSVLRENWALRPTGVIDTLKALFYGTCVAFLGVTGFECTPTYIEHMQPKTYASVLRNLIIIAASLGGTLCLLCFAVLPYSDVTGGNVLSLLGETIAGGRWMRIWVVIDAVCVLMGGVLAGFVTCGGLIDRLARDCVLPQVFLVTTPVTNGAYVATAFSVLLAILLWLASGMNVNTASGMFSVAFLFVMLLFATSNFVLKYNRPTLPRTYRAGLCALTGALFSLSITWAGNIALAPSTLKLFAPSFILIGLAFFVLGSQPRIARLALRFFEPSPRGSWKITRLLNRYLVRWYKRTRDAKVCVWIKHDDIHMMLRALLSIQANAPEACTVVFVHAYPSTEDIPTELEPNTRLLDEAFPMVTIDLAFVKGTFSPCLVHAASEALGVPTSRMCVLRLGSEHMWALGDYDGVRVIG